MNETRAEKKQRDAAMVGGEDLLTVIGGEIDKLLQPDSGVPDSVPDGEGSYRFPRRALQEIKARIDAARGVDVPDGVTKEA
jgi:hypothetical protein